LEVNGMLRYLADPQRMLLGCIPAGLLVVVYVVQRVREHRQLARDRVACLRADEEACASILAQRAKMEAASKASIIETLAV
jgi:hypothetical protein